MKRIRDGVEELLGQGAEVEKGEHGPGNVEALRLYARFQEACAMANGALRP